jgi:hypothetical protein
MKLKTMSLRQAFKANETRRDPHPTLGSAPEPLRYSVYFCAYLDRDKLADWISAAPNLGAHASVTPSATEGYKLMLGRA